MHKKKPWRSPLSTTLQLALLLSSCLVGGLSCEEWRVMARDGSVDRVRRVPKVGAPAASVVSDAAVLTDSGADAAAPTDAAPDADAGADASTRERHVERAILVSVDGLGGRYLVEQFSKGKLPGFAALQRAGSSTLNARADYEITVTLPNHTTMLTGRPVLRDPELPADVHHGLTVNSLMDVDYTLHNLGTTDSKYVASIFDVVHDHGKKTCMYAGKAKFILYANSFDAKHGAADITGVDNGRNKIDRVVILENDSELLISTAEADLALGVCDFAFIHIADTDTPLGHGTGWGSDAWYAGLDRVDSWIGRLAKFTRVGDAGSPMGLVVTADHGGQSFNHSDSTEIWNYQIPFFAVGPGFTPNTDLYAIALGKRSDPGLVRPRYSVTFQPIRNADAANVVLAMLGLPPVPGSYMRNLLGPQ